MAVRMKVNRIVTVLAMFLIEKYSRIRFLFWGRSGLQIRSQSVGVTMKRHKHGSPVCEPAP